MSYEAGKQAALEGKTLADNPHTNGFTKLGSVKLTEEGHEWARGFGDVPRKVTKKEIADSRKMDISRFKRKSNRYYQG